ncbi:sterol desaturase family protein [Methylobrevis pamukkalensis]|uniref:Fatty acid hydroxylase superfamily protein n=1 Tax=Methylobrevis pamukkalensis TaxID=1439726 RepID=A0A1E3H0F1_9HYPH|nr:sterol desaturase family protein [Methylobrevis pamukkalensis]ODN69770.1 Fatty acid hydroxylase superfamily protein [Methylobrevis pamukkalensis]
MSAEAALRLAAFLSIFLVVAVVEWRLPKRVPREDRWARWRVNLSVLLLDVVVQRLTLGAAAYVAALHAADNGWGLFAVLDWPPALEALIGFLALDLAIYAQHVASHSWPVFWRLHAVHHADLDIDVTTGTRFHPVEILLSLVWKAGIVLALGIDPWTVVVFEATLNGAAMFSHANIRLPRRVDAALRLLVVTPDMHRVHHSVLPREAHANFGFFLSVWDRLFGTLVGQPQGGHDGMTIGLPGGAHRQPLGFLAILRLPFSRGGWRDPATAAATGATEKAPESAISEPAAPPLAPARTDPP